MEERLRRVLDAHCLPCGAVIAATGNVVALAGDFDSFASAGLVSALLGPYGSAEATYRRVQDPDQVKPMIWRQGRDFAFVDCADELAVVVFGRDRGDIHVQYALSRQVGLSIAAIFGSSEAEPGAALDRGGIK
jgi:hypothetical protein